MNLNPGLQSVTFRIFVLQYRTQIKITKKAFPCWASFFTAAVTHATADITHATAAVTHATAAIILSKSVRHDKQLWRAIADKTGFNFNKDISRLIP